MTINVSVLSYDYALQLDIVYSNNISVGSTYQIHRRVRVLYRIGLADCSHVTAIILSHCVEDK